MMWHCHSGPKIRPRNLLSESKSSGIRLLYTTIASVGGFDFWCEYDGGREAWSLLDAPGSSSSQQQQQPQEATAAVPAMIPNMYTTIASKGGFNFWCKYNGGREAWELLGAPGSSSSQQQQQPQEATAAVAAEQQPATIEKFKCL